MTGLHHDPATTTVALSRRPEARLIEAALQLSSATMHEAQGRRGALPPEIKPVAPTMRICGPAVTVHSPPGDNLWLHRAIYAAEPGDVLVVATDKGWDYGYWGEIMATAAQVRGLGGLVIDGGVRDIVLLREIDFPIFSRGLCIRGTGKDFGARGWINAPILIGDQVVDAGDLVVGDEDGVVVVKRGALDDVIKDSIERDERETRIIERVRKGEGTLSIYGWE